MAGNQTTRDRLASAMKRIGELEQENADMRRKMAAHGISDMPAPVAAEYSPEINERVLAMGNQGMTESEWIAALGLTVETWDDWKRDNPSLFDTAAKAHAKMQAYWDNQARVAMSTSNTRFPMQLYREVKAQPMRGVSGTKGDASKFVVVDTRGLVLEIKHKNGESTKHPIPPGTLHHVLNLNQ